MNNNEPSLFGIFLQKLDKKNILEKVVRAQEDPSSYLHVVSLNPENIVIAEKDTIFKKVLKNADVRIIDGVGLLVTTRFFFRDRFQRISGVDLMKYILDYSPKQRFRILFLGGEENVAEELALCYQRQFPKNSYKGIRGIRNINKATKKEQNDIFSIISEFRPHVCFASFGSPYQEKWFFENKEKLKGIACIGVGGAFDFLAGRIPRAPYAVRYIGLEWLFRLVLQPWRWRRQLRLFIFIWLVIGEMVRRKAKK